MMFSGKSECSAVCGDAKIVPHVEDCDDGNAVSGDGCSMQCKLEGGFVCNSVGLPCKLIVCGDGEVNVCYHISRFILMLILSLLHAHCDPFAVLPRWMRR